MSRENKKITIEFSQLTFWRVATVVFAVLFIISVMTDGFSGTSGSAQAAQQGQRNAGAPAQAAAPIQAPAQQTRVKLDISKAPTFGDPDADVTIIECTDYQCPFCSRAFTTTLPQIKKDYIETGKANYATLDLPLPFHTEADEAAIAARCAGKQDKYWEMHDKLFEAQASWAGNADPNTVFNGYAAELGLDTGDFKGCLGDASVRKAVESDLAACNNAGATGTPTFFINGLKLVGAQPYQQFQTLIDAELNN